MCQHQPPCPTADSADRESARLVAHHPEQGWSLLCNGVLLFEDTGELLPDGQIIAPHRPLGGAGDDGRLSRTTRAAVTGRPDTRGAGPETTLRTGPDACPRCHSP